MCRQRMICYTHVHMYTYHVRLGAKYMYCIYVDCILYLFFSSIYNLYPSFFLLYIYQLLSMNLIKIINLNEYNLCSFFLLYICTKQQTLIVTSTSWTDEHNRLSSCFFAHIPYALHTCAVRICKHAHARSELYIVSDRRFRIHVDIQRGCLIHMVLQYLT